MLVTVRVTADEGKPDTGKRFKKGRKRMKGNYVAPKPGEAAFNCAKCSVFAKQTWFYMSGSTNPDGFGGILEDERFVISRCEHCQFPTIWLGQQMIFPHDMSAEPPAEDMPKDIARDYNEARQ